MGEQSKTEDEAPKVTTAPASHPDETRRRFWRWSRLMQNPRGETADAILMADTEIAAALRTELSRLSQAALIHHGERPSWPFVAEWLNREAGQHPDPR